MADEPWLLIAAMWIGFFLGGDNAGANIAHKIAMTVGKEGLPGGLKHQAWQGLGVLCCCECF